MLAIVPNQVIKLVNENCHAGLIIKTDDQGMTTTYAVKTKKNSTQPGEVKVKYADGWQLIHPKTCADVTAIFAEFLDIINGHFQTSNHVAPRSRCYAILTDGIIKNRDPNAVLTVKYYDCIINGEFIKYDMGKCQRRPLDLSTDWQPFEPTRAHKVQIENIVKGTNRYLNKKTTAIMLQNRRNASTGIF